MPPGTLSREDRQRVLHHMQQQLLQLGQPLDKAQDMAYKVEDAAYNRASTHEAYNSFIQTSLRKAEVALQAKAAQAQAQAQAQARQGMTQHAAQQQAGGHYGAVQQPGALQGLQYHQPTVQQPAAQQQHVYGMQPAVQQHGMHQGQQVAQHQPQGQYVGMGQPQQQYMQAQQQHQMQQQYMQSAPQAQQYMHQQQYAQHAPAVAQQQQQYMQVQQQQQYLQTALPQQQYMQAVPQQQYAHQAPAALSQQQYMQAQPASQQHYMQPQAQQQHQQQAAPVQQQYLQHQPQAQQQHYMQHQATQHQHQHQQAMHHQAQAALAPPQQQYSSQARGGGFAVQQYGALQPGQQQALQAQQMGLASQGSATHQALLPRQLAPTDLHRLPAFDDSAFQDLAADYLSPVPQPAHQPAAASQPTPPFAMPQAQQPRYQAQQAASVADSTAPALGSPQAAAGARQAPQRPLIAGPLQHEPAALQEYLRLHAAFNGQEHRGLAKDTERMLRFYQQSAKAQPKVAERMGERVQRYARLLQLLQMEKPAETLSITESVLKHTKALIKEVTSFQEIVKNTRRKALDEKAAAAAPGGAPAASSPGGYMAMMESADSEALRAGGAPAPLAAPPPAVKLEPAAATGQAPSRPAPTAAEAARQQALLRQRRLLEEQKRREAAAAAAPPLPTAAPQRLLAVAARQRPAHEAAAVQGGFKRLQRVVHAAELKAVTGQAPGVATPPLPPEAQRLVARDAAAWAAAQQAGGGAQALPALVTSAAAHGFAVVPRQEAVAAPGSAGEPPAKLQRSDSLDPAAVAGELAAAGGGEAAPAGQRVKSELEAQLEGECREAAEALGGAVLLRVAPDSGDPACAVVTCMPKAAQGGSGTAGGGEQRWQLLLLRVGLGYPHEPPTAVFPRLGHGGASAAKAAAAERQQLLADACFERFAAAAAALPAGARLPQLVGAWLEATQAVAARVQQRREQQEQA